MVLVGQPVGQRAASWIGTGTGAPLQRPLGTSGKFASGDLSGEPLHRMPGVCSAYAKCGWLKQLSELIEWAAASSLKVWGSIVSPLSRSLQPMRRPFGSFVTIERSMQRYSSSSTLCAYAFAPMLFRRRSNLSGHRAGTGYTSAWCISDTRVGRAASTSGACSTF